MTRTLRTAFSLTLGLGLTACGGDDTVVPTQPEVPTVQAKVLALSTYKASLGTMIEAYGTDFPKPAEGRTQLRFVGFFDTVDGVRSPVDLAVPVRRVDGGTLRWGGFGPYGNPFSSTNEIGWFSGTVGARVVTRDGTVVDEAQPTPVTFEVTPSVVVHDFQPVTATCDAGILRGIGGAAYRLTVEAVGFEPESFTYIISAPALGYEPIRIRKIVDESMDTIGQRADLILPNVPSNVPSYGAIITVQARNKAGDTVQSSFGLGVHRPLEVFYNGNVEVAEVLAPTPVSGCMPGGVTGRDVSYAESQAETRNRAFAVSWNESWLSSHTVSQGSSETIGLSERNGVGFSTTNGQSFNWSLGTEVDGSVGLTDLVKMGVGFSAGVGGDTSLSNTQSANRESGVNASSTTTETESVSQSQGGSQGESFSWSVSSTEVIARGFGGYVIPDTYGVFYRQTIRLVRRAALVAYNQCGFAQVVGEVDFTDWTWSPDLALGDSCPPLPQSNLPAAECNISPCAGE